MAFWKKSPPTTAQQPPDQLQSRLEALESAIRLLKAEWTDTLDLMNRRAARIERANQRAAETEEPPKGEAPGAPQAPDLTPTQVAARNRVMERRGLRAH